MTLLKPVASLLLLTTAAAPFANAQFTLPGLGAKPGNPNALDAVLACGNATNKLLSIPAVYSSLSALRQQAVMKLQNPSSCQYRGSSLVCSLNYAGIQSDFKSACENNGGVYDENNQSVNCTAPNDPFSTGYAIYEFENYPSCFSSTCSACDTQRWISDNVVSFETAVDKGTSWVCDSAYKIETNTKAPATTGTCPNRQNDTPQKCGPLSGNLQDHQCDCYTFCDGKLVACDKFDSTGSSSIFCAGNLVMGCTDQMFASYDMNTQAQQMAASAAAKKDVVGAAVVGTATVMSAIAMVWML